jgi:glycosyltransferase involved in cell wall biosynthesis
VGAIEVKVFEDRLIELPVMVPRDASKPYIYLTGIGKSGAGHPWVAELERVLLRNPCATLLMDDHRSLFEAINVGNKCFVDRSAVVSAESFAHCSIAILGGEAGDGAGALGRPFLRAAAYGMACVAAGSAFEGIVKHGVTGALVGGASGFGEALEILIREPVRCVAMARAARAWVSENRMFSQTISDQADWLKTLVSRQEASLSPVPPVNPA